jgi:hypothetical protein
VSLGSLPVDLAGFTVNFEVLQLYFASFTFYLESFALYLGDFTVYLGSFAADFGDFGVHVGRLTLRTEDLRVRVGGWTSGPRWCQIFCINGQGPLPKSGFRIACSATRPASSRVL